MTVLGAGVLLYSAGVGLVAGSLIGMIGVGGIIIVPCLTLLPEVRTPPPRSVLPGVVFRPARRRPLRPPHPRSAAAAGRGRRHPDRDRLRDVLLHGCRRRRAADVCPQRLDRVAGARRA